jgi:hypothetical protein
MSQNNLVIQSISFLGVEVSINGLNIGNFLVVSLVGLNRGEVTLFFVSLKKNQEDFLACLNANINILL